MFNDELLAAAENLVAHCRSRGRRLALAESCTGGLVAGLLTEVIGVSDTVERGFVTYSNEAKMEMLGVPAHLIHQHGAVSEPVARAMAEGALARSPADASVAITGIAGPSGGSAEKPIGLVHFAAAGRDFGSVHLEKRFGDIGRTAVRLESVAVALDLLDRMVCSDEGPPAP